MASSIEALLNPNEIRLNLEAPNLEEELTRFNELFELLLANSRETDLDEAVKVARWKILAGEPARKKLRECQWEPGEKMTIESMTAKLVKGLPRTSGTVSSIFVARKAFWRRECKPGEGFSAWLADLGAMLTRCSYEKPDKVLRDKIVCFHPDDELAAQLVVLDEDVSLDAVIAKCRSHELTHEHQSERLVSNDRKRKPDVDAMEQDRDEGNVQADEPQDQQEIPNKSEDSGDVVLRDQSLMQIPPTKYFMPHPRNACYRCRRQSRRAAAMMAREQEVMAVDAEKVKLESAVGLTDGAESTPAAVDEEAEGSMLGDELLANEASPPDAAEEVTAPTEGVLASHSQVRIVDISRLLEKEDQKADVGVVAAKTVRDITVGAITTAADHVDIRVNVDATMNQKRSKVAVDTNANRKKKKIDDVLIPKAESDAVPRKSKYAAKKARKARRRQELAAAALRESEGCALESGGIGKNRAEPSTSSGHGGQQESPDTAVGKTSAAAGTHVPQESTNCPQQVAGDAIDIKKNVGATVNSNVKVSKPIANANGQKKKKKKVPDAKIQKPAKKSNRNKRKNAHVHNSCRHEWQQHAPIPWEWGWEPHPLEWGWMGNNWEGPPMWPGPSTWPGHNNNWQQRRHNAAGGKKSAPTPPSCPQQESNNRAQQQKEAKMGMEVDAAVDIKVEVDAMMDLDVKVNLPIVNGDVQEKV